MNARLAGVLTAAHAPAWRRRYGGEFQALLVELPATPAIVASAAASAVASRARLLGAVAAGTLAAALLVLAPAASDRRSATDAVPASVDAWSARVPCRETRLVHLARDGSIHCRLG